MSTRLVSTQVAAERIGVTTKSIRNWVADGRLPAVRLGRVIRIDLDDLDAFARPRVEPEIPAPQPQRINVSLPAREAFAEYIARVVAEAPPLTPDQVARITTLLNSAAA
ncbi:helix-turn-helix domain-containing protein [Nocardia wallacei]|uniref:helix-turn-helix domain-containing protein n=1 Tax=Nocardia wallacei TaxID=480035 RepID=UPI00245525A6|nr:helix-turn-helix domain-containing protein [Nocardia wallacei]